MKKPQLCLALSVSLALLQANLVPMLAEPVMPSSWHTVSTGTESAAANKASSALAGKAKAVTAKVAVKTPAHKKTASLAPYNAHSIATGGISGQEMLFFSGKNKQSSDLQMPAAALTIHPALSIDSVNADVQVSQTESPTLVAMSETNDSSVTDGSSAVSQAPVVSDASVPADSGDSTKTDSANNKFVAQLSPDQIVAQGDQAGTTATPIPPVVSGAIELEEFKPSNVLELKVGQSRTFKLRNKIVRTSISDPASADAVVMSEHELMLLGKAPGTTTLVVWDDSGNSSAIDVKVSRDYSQLQATLREIDPRIIVKAFSVGGSDRVLLLGDVDHPESVLRSFSAANAFMDDRGMQILAAVNRLLDKSLGEKSSAGGGSSGGGGGGGATSGLAQLAQVDKYTFFSNLNNNVGKAQVIVSDGGRVTSLVRVRKNPLIVLHCTFMEMNTAAVRELGVQLGLAMTSQNFSFAIGGAGTSGTNSTTTSLYSNPGLSGTQGVGQQIWEQSVPVVNTINGNGTFNPFTLDSGFNMPVGSPFPWPNAINTGGFAVPTFGTTSGQVGALVQSIPQKLINYGAVSSPVNFSPSSAIASLGQAVLNGAPSALLGQATLLGSPAGAVFSPANLANAFTAFSNFAKNANSRWSLNPTMQGIITHSRARVLAEPTLVTMSGERAAFLAGGEIPILQSIATAGTSQQSVVFEPFGLRLNMIPVLMENGAINLEVSPEERLLSQANSLRILGGDNSAIPGFTVRKTQTIVEMRPGQELYISGLVTANSGREVNKTPLLGEIPVLGALYRSKAFNKNESELVVAVRPEIILPGAPGQMKLPEEISKVEGPRDTNMLQVEPTIVDERYNTSGRSERNQKIPGIQPGNAPIPDSD
jgi:Flp pilus assembly secretin CpaC